MLTVGILFGGRITSEEGTTINQFCPAVTERRGDGGETVNDPDPDECMLGFGKIHEGGYWQAFTGQLTAKSTDNQIAEVE